MIVNFRRKKVKSWVTQIALSILLLGVAYYFIGNVIDNLQRLGVASGFSFLYARAGYDLYSPILDYTADSRHIDAYFVGLVNTILVSLLGIVFATFLGFVLGILRLSSNWLVSKTMYLIVEFNRNVPLLIWIIIWYFGVFLQLPSPKAALNILDVVFISNRGMYVPKPEFSVAFFSVLLAVGIGIVMKIVYTRHAKKVQDATGKQSPVFSMSLLFIVGLPTLCYLALHDSITWSIPYLKGFNFKGGTALKPEFISLLMGLSIYTACNIAEIVRSGILSVSEGQKEAAQSLNLKQAQMMKMIILPQALRVIIPPLNSQFLNLTKNSSLAIAVGYTDVVSTIGGTTLNQTGQALECITILMITYLTLSLTISAIMNLINRKVQF